MSAEQCVRVTALTRNFICANKDEYYTDTRPAAKVFIIEQNSCLF